MNIHDDEKRSTEWNTDWKLFLNRYAEHEGVEGACMPSPKGHVQEKRDIIIRYAQVSE